MATHNSPQSEEFFCRTTLTILIVRTSAEQNARQAIVYTVEVERLEYIVSLTNTTCGSQPMLDTRFQLLPRTFSICANINTSVCLEAV